MYQTIYFSFYVTLRTVEVSIVYVDRLLASNKNPMKFSLSSYREAISSNIPRRTTHAWAWEEPCEKQHKRN